MTTDQKCARCGKKIRLSRAGTLTQWLKTTGDCSCDSQNTFQSPYKDDSTEERISLKCPVCGKEKMASREGSMTQWIFKDSRCNCDWAALGISIEFDTKETIVKPPEVIDDEIRRLLEAEDIDYHNFSPDSFPFDRFRIMEEIGAGHSGRVFKCWDLSLSKRVAIKMIHDWKLSPDSLVKLQFEAKAQSKLNHPNVVSILDFNTASGGDPYIVMEFVDGVTLYEIIKQHGAIPQNKALIMFSQICAAIAHAHHHKVLHRDIKALNILVRDFESSTPTAKVIDFGIAALTQSVTVKTDSHGNASLIGSPLYMSPEQLKGKLFDERSDIYSLGTVFVEALTGVNPFRGEHVFESINNHANKELPPQAEINPEVKINNRVWSIVKRMLCKDPDQRYQTVAEVKELIDSCILFPSHEGDEENRDKALLVSDSPDGGAAARSSTKTAPKRKGDPILLSIGMACLLFLTSIFFMVKKPHENSKKEAAEEKQPAPLDEEATKQSYMEEMLMPNSSKGDEYLKSLKNTQYNPHINLMMSEVTDEGIKSIENLSFESIDLSYTKITDASLESLAKNRHLKQICLRGTPVTEHGIDVLTKARDLNSIDLSVMKVTEPILRDVARMPSLKSIYMIQTSNVSADALKPLTQAKNLQILFIRRSRLGKPQLEVLSQCKNIERLLLSHTGLKDSDLTPLKNLKKLKQLDVAGNDISNEGLAIISEIKQLKELYIANCPRINRMGMKDFVQHNKSCAIRLEYGPTVLGSGQM